MTLIELLILLLIAAVSGSIGQAIAGFSVGGLLTTIAIGFVGALLGAAIARGLQLPEPFVVRVGESSFPIIWSIIGSALFVAAIAMFRRAAGAKPV